MMRERTRIRIARAVALDLEGYKGPEIAGFLGMKPTGLDTLRARPEYKAQLLKAGNELIRRMDEALTAARFSEMSDEELKAHISVLKGAEADTKANVGRSSTISMENGERYQKVSENDGSSLIGDCSQPVGPTW